MGTHSADPLQAYHWEVQPQAGEVIATLLAGIVEHSPPAQHLVTRMLAVTGTRLLDWIDHLRVRESSALAAQLAAAGFVCRPQLDAPRCFIHHGGLFPAVLLIDDGRPALAVRVEAVADFLAAHERDVQIEGAPLAPYRRACVWPGEAEVWAVERHGHAGFVLAGQPAERAVAAQHHYEVFRTRYRDAGDDMQGFAHARVLIDCAIADLGVDLACDRFFAAERDFWQRRNRAARVQKARQDVLGLGWGNHDHHTYRSSRACFPALIATFEALGFYCRERFHPGHNAGWGAQVLEQSATGIVIFADVDMNADELHGDFAHRAFPADPKRPLGTVGLWCALHGESFLQAGMHHLEATFAFDVVRPQLEREGIPSMPPFTNFPHLRQCFTAGERWGVRPERSKRLLDAGLITAAQADQFRTQGAIGSHLEVLERNQGFKGFNQQGVDQIIAGTDPRRAQ